MISEINGKTITFAGGPLKYRHYGNVYQPSGAPAAHAIDMRGEVALLSRNVVVRGSTAGGAGTAGWGGHIMALGAAQMRIANIEVTQMGQRGELGRYPIHFHVTEHNPHSYVKGNSIHDTYQRCVTVHGTHELLVQGNVGYHSVGHCFFIEDGNESKNVFDRNLGVRPVPG